MKAFVLALGVLISGPCFSVEPSLVVVAAQMEETQNHLAWVVDADGNGHFESCDALSCQAVTGSLSPDETTRFFWFYQDKLAQISRQESHSEQGFTNPLTGDRTLKEFAKIFLLQIGIVAPGMLAMEYLDNEYLFPISLVAALSAMAIRGIIVHKRFEKEGRKASGLLPLAHQLEKAAQLGTVLLTAEDYAYLVQTLQQAFDVFKSQQAPEAR